MKYQTNKQTGGKNWVVEKWYEKFIYALGVFNAIYLVIALIGLFLGSL